MSIDTRARRAADGVHASARGVNPMTQLVELKQEDKTRQRTGLILTTAVVLVVVLGTLAASTRWLGTDDAAPPAGRSVTDEARDLASRFFDAYRAYDADRAMSYLTASAIAGEWGSPEGFRDERAWSRAAGWTNLIDPCEQVSRAGNAVSLRCGFLVHALGSEELGRGPFGDSSWAITVRDGKIVQVHADFPFMSNGFSEQMWEPFANWVSTTYPRDADIMYTDGSRSEGRATPESLWLWEQHIRDYVDERTSETASSPSSE